MYKEDYEKGKDLDYEDVHERGRRLALVITSSVMFSGLAFGR